VNITRTVFKFSTVSALTISWWSLLKPKFIRVPVLLGYLDVQFPGFAENGNWAPAFWDG
jgi:hypothetical protein